MTAGNQAGKSPSRRKAPVLAYPEHISETMDLPAFDGERRAYLISSTPRCGSHLLGHALMETKVFGCPMEYINKGNLIGWRQRFGPKNSEADLIRKIVELRTGPSGWFGIKAHWTQFERILGKPSFAALPPISKHVFIYRRDLLGQAISLLRARQTGAWISGAQEQRPPSYSKSGILLCAKRIRRQNLAWVSYLSRRGDFFPICYEDLAAGLEAELGKIIHFLDPACEVGIAPPERTKKQSDRISREWRDLFLAENGAGGKWIMESQSIESFQKALSGAERGKADSA